jgi:hypothetical protein
MRFGPDACLRVADAIRRYLASAPGGGGGDLPAGVDIAGQGRPQFLGVAGIQVNLVLRAIQPEDDSSLCFATVEVVDKEGLSPFLSVFLAFNSTAYVIGMQNRIPPG